MIVLQDVHKSVEGGARAASFSINHASFELPPGRRVAVFGRDVAAMGMLLHLIAGSEVPDAGQVVTGKSRRSPIVNAAGRPGAILAPKLGALANIKYFAGVRGVDYHKLLELVILSCDIGQRLEQPVKSLEASTQRALEVAIIGALPYDYYLVDRFEKLEPDLRWRFVHAARRRKASLIFATTDLTTGVLFGEAGIACMGESMRMYDDVRAGVEAYRRLAPPINATTSNPIGTKRTRDAIAK